MRRSGTQLRDSRGLLRTYAWLIIAVTLATVGVALALSALRPVSYTSTSQVVVKPEVTTGAPVAPDMGTERAIAMSGDVTKVAAAALGLSADDAAAGLAVAVPVETSVLEISYTADSPQNAYKGATVFTEAYVNYRNQNRKTPVAQMITPPDEPLAPSGTNYPIVIGLGLILGAILGVGAALAWDRVTDRLRGVQDTQAQTGLPVLASIPALRLGGPHQVVRLEGPQTPGAAAYGYLTAQLMHLIGDRSSSSVLVTSPSPGAGKSTTAVNLAVQLAGIGKDVIVVSADPRLSTVHEMFSVQRSPGLVEVLDGSASLERALHTSDVKGLRVMTSGTPQTLGEVYFNLEDMKVLLGRLAKTAEIVVVDASTVLAAAEVALVANQVDMVLLVVDGKRGLRADAAAAVEALRHVRSKVVGCVINAPRKQRGRSARRVARAARSQAPLEPATDVAELGGIHRVRI
jgi:capsular exopolysaccharide synthesis family protein